MLAWCLGWSVLVGGVLIVGAAAVWPGTTPDYMLVWGCLIGILGGLTVATSDNGLS